MLYSGVDVFLDARTKYREETTFFDEFFEGIEYC